MASLSERLSAPQQTMDRAFFRSVIVSFRMRKHSKLLTKQNLASRRIMMQDYKFRHRNLARQPRRGTARSGLTRSIMVLLGIGVVLLLALTAFDLWQQAADDRGTSNTAPATIPLPIPPRPEDTSS
ncbi:hypothetical protein ABC977_10235 [Thioalkalicoccus limnaeus]|uniref:Uncharacterized protein n=1 Tax=Thioalkalicoccus limnaeus TaxID=120681 RepID=A0ABV4BFN5_9GAMM